MELQVVRSARTAAAVACMLLAASAHAGAPVPPSGLRYVVIGDTDVPVAPGAQATLTFEIVNDRPVESPAGTTIGTGIPISDSGYSLAVAPGSVCGAIMPPPVPGFPGLAFSVSRPAIPAGGRVRCSYRLSRASASNRVASVLFGEVCSLGPSLAQLPCGAVFRVGTFGDIGLTYALTAPVPRGATSAIVRITATNAGTIAADQVWIAACGDLPNQFRYGTDVPDACTFDAEFAPACFLDAVAWRVGGVPTGDRTSCQLRLDFGGPLLGPRYGFLTLEGARYPGNGSVWDTNRANDMLSIGVAPQDPAAVPVARSTIVLLILGMLGCGLLARVELLTLRGGTHPSQWPPGRATCLNPEQSVS